MPRPPKHPSKTDRYDESRDKLNELRSLPEWPPIDLDDDELAIWRREIIPLIRLGVLKETDAGICVDYCQLAAVPIRRRSVAHLTAVRSMRNAIGLSAQARLRISPAADAPTQKSLEEILEEVMRSGEN